MFYRHLNRFPPFFFSAICMLAIMYLTLFPDPVPDTELPTFPNADKVVHAIMFGGLYFCLVFDTLRKGREVTLLRKSVYGTIAILAGLVIEFLQTWMAMGRSGDFADFGADVAGVVIVMALYPGHVKCNME